MDSAKLQQKIKEYKTKQREVANLHDLLTEELTEDIRRRLTLEDLKSAEGLQVTRDEYRRTVVTVLVGTKGRKPSNATICAALDEANAYLTHAYGKSVLDEELVLVRWSEG